MEVKTQNLLRHLWLLRVPGMIAALVWALNEHPLALLWLMLETLVTGVVAIVFCWIPAEMLDQYVPVTRSGLSWQIPLVVHALCLVPVGVVTAHLLLVAVRLHKSLKVERWRAAHAA